MESEMLDSFYSVCDTVVLDDSNMDWLENYPNPEKKDYGFADFMRSIDGILIARLTYETVLRFEVWPYTKPVFVFSDTLQALPKKLENKAQIVSGSLTSILSKLKDQGINVLYVNGGKTIQSFLREDRIEEMIINKIPILLGDGIPLFGGYENELHFEHIKTEVFSNGFVISHYRRNRR
jgi:dihydrofolate reductase